MTNNESNKVSSLDTILKFLIHLNFLFPYIEKFKVNIEDLFVLKVKYKMHLNSNMKH